MIMTRFAIPLTETRQAVPTALAGVPADKQQAKLAAENLGQLLQPVLDQLVEICGARAGSISILAPDGRSLLPVLERGDCRAAPAVASSISLPLLHSGRRVGQLELWHPAASHGKDLPEPALSLIGKLLALLLQQANEAEERTQAAREQEHRAMLGEVHDVLAQSLSYARMRLPLLQDAILAQDGPAGLKHLAEVRQTVGEAHTGLRQLMSAFRSRSERKGLLHALQGLALSMAENNDLRLEIRNVRSGLDLNDRQETQVFRIVQEAIANVAKHSGARSATVSLAGDADVLEVSVEDRGTGIRPSDSAHKNGQGLGLGLMRSRAQSVGGSVEIGARTGGGTLVQLRLPLAHGANEGRR